MLFLVDKGRSSTTSLLEKEEKGRERELMLACHRAGSSGVSVTSRKVLGKASVSSLPLPHCKQHD